MLLPSMSLKDFQLPFDWHSICSYTWTYYVLVVLLTLLNSVCIFDVQGGNCSFTWSKWAQVCNVFPQTYLYEVELYYIFNHNFLCFFCAVEGTVILQRSLMQMDSRSSESIGLVSLIDSSVDILLDKLQLCFFIY